MPVKSASGKSPSQGGSTGGRAAPLHCAECGWRTARWVGRCPDCGAWSSVVEIPRAGTSGRGVGTGVAGGHPQAPAEPARPIAEIDAGAARGRPTGMGEVDRVLGGGLVPGSVVLLAGEPGVGKSTLLLEVAAAVAGRGGRSLYITGEESAAQVRMRAERLGALDERLLLAAETEIGPVLSHIDAVSPDLLVLDSVQTVTADTVDGAAGGPTQVREVAATLTAVARSRGMSVILVGHVTKDGAIAGPRTLEHLVDVVLHFEGERHARLRILRAVKNRFGASDEIGCFELRDDGLQGLVDPSGLFLSGSGSPVSGTCITVGLEGRRPLLAEVQALVTESVGTVPRRATSGLDAARHELVLAVLQKRAGVAAGKYDVYAATVGGARLTEPAADLALAVALTTSALNSVPHTGLVAFGEIGLAGDIRRVPGLSRRLAEAARIGYTSAVVPHQDDVVVPDGMTVHLVKEINDALRLAGCAKPRSEPRGLVAFPG